MSIVSILLLLDFFTTFPLLSICHLHCKTILNLEFSSEVFHCQEHHLWVIYVLAWTTKTEAFVRVYWHTRLEAAAKCLSAACPFRPQPASTIHRSGAALFPVERQRSCYDDATSGGTWTGLPSKSVLKSYVHFHLCIVERLLNTSL